jgi:hypothetical protein
MLQFLTERYGLAAEPVAANVIAVLRHFRGTEELPWVLETFGKHLPREIILAYFENCCRSDFAAAQWLARECNITRNEAVGDGIHSLPSVIMGEWLVERYQVTWSDVRDSRAFESILDGARCVQHRGTRGYGTLEWVIYALRLSKEDVARLINMHKPSENAMAAWAHAHFASSE